MNVRVSVCSLLDTVSGLVPDTTLMNRGSLYVRSNKKIGDIFPYLAHALMQQTEKVWGLFDNSLVGMAYQTYDWKTDEAWNSTRRVEIKLAFLNMLRASVFCTTRHRIFIALSPTEAARILHLASEHTTSTHERTGMAYTLCVQKAQTPKPIRNIKLLRLFAHWLDKREKGQQG